MKRLFLLILPIFLIQFSFAQDDEEMQILNLNTSTINIGGKDKKVGEKFSVKSTIKWSSPNQVMECKKANSQSPDIYVFSSQQFQSKGAVKSVAEYLLRLGKASTRSANSSMPSFTHGKNKNDFPEKRCALVIGNSNYSKIARLRNPVKDAGDISAKLMDLGFDVMTAYDCVYTEMDALLDSFSERARGYQVALIFYAGHGIQDGGLNYLIPIDNQLGTKEYDLPKCIAASHMVEKLQETGCSSRILILDACRDIYTSWTRSVNNGFAYMEGPHGMVIIFSTQAGKTAYDGEGFNSPFAKAFLDNIDGPESFSDMMKDVVNDTYRNTNKVQNPMVIGTLEEKFFFAPVAWQGSQNTEKPNNSSRPLSDNSNAVSAPNNYSQRVIPKNSQINQSLASYYSFEHKNADDESGNNLDGVANSAVEFVADTPSGTGYSARLNGYKKGQVNIPYNVFAGKTNYSIAFWIKDFDYGVIVSAISSEYPRSDFPRILATMGNRFRFFTSYDNWDSTERFDFDTSVIKDSEWHHVVVTCSQTEDYRNNATRRLYVDGRLVSVSMGSADRYYNVHGYDENIIRKIQIGGDRNGAYDHSASMIIDNVRFYTIAISEQTVQELYNYKL